MTEYIYVDSQIWDEFAKAGLSHDERIVALFALTYPPEWFAALSPQRVSSVVGIPPETAEKALSSASEKMGWTFNRALCAVTSWGA